MRLVRRPDRANLNKLDGVEATVNYATETAAVAFDPVGVAPEELVGAVEAAGYRREPAGDAELDRRSPRARRRPELRSLRRA